MNAAEILIAAGFLGLGAYFLLRKQQTAPPATTGGGAHVPSSIQEFLSLGITNPNALNHAIFGVGTDTFKTFGQMSDFDVLKHNMCACYRGNAEACREALAQAPGLRTCKPGDCDCNPTFVKPGTVSYRDSHGGPYQADFGVKDIAVQTFESSAPVVTPTSPAPTVRSAAWRFFP